MFLLKQLCGGSYIHRERFTLGGGECFTLGGGGHLEEAVAELDLLASPPLRSSGIGDGFLLVGPAPSLQKGVAPLWLEVLLCWLVSGKRGGKGKEGGEAGGDIERHA